MILAYEIVLSTKTRFSELRRQNSSKQFLSTRLLRLGDSNCYLALCWAFSCNWGRSMGLLPSVIHMSLKIIIMPERWRRKEPPCHLNDEAYKQQMYADSVVFSILRKRNLLQAISEAKIKLLSSVIASLLHNLVFSTMILNFVSLPYNILLSPVIQQN